MSGRKNRLNLPPLLKEKFAAILGGKTPTTERLLKLLDKEPPMDKSDIEQGRVPYTPREHAEAVAAGSTVPIDVEDAVAGATDAQQRRVAEGRGRVADRIMEHSARGLDPNSPPEDPAAAALAAEETPDPGPAWGREHHLGLMATTAQSRDFPLPEAEADEIARRKSAGTAKLREVADGMERRVLQRMPAIAGSGGKLRSLEEAAEILIGELQPGSIDAIRQVCAEHSLEPWVVILGAVERMAVLQELHAGDFDPEWVNRGPGGSKPASIKEQKCQACGGVLPTDARRGQGYCCSFHGSSRLDHNEGCSLAYLQMREGRWVDTRRLGVRS